MATVIGPSRSPVMRALRELEAQTERRTKRISKVYRAKDLSQLPAAKSKNAKSRGAKRGKPKEKSWTTQLKPVPNRAAKCRATNATSRCGR